METPVVANWMTPNPSKGLARRGLSLEKNRKSNPLTFSRKKPAATNMPERILRRLRFFRGDSAAVSSSTANVLSGEPVMREASSIEAPDTTEGGKGNSELGLRPGRSFRIFESAHEPGLRVMKVFRCLAVAWPAKSTSPGAHVTRYGGCLRPEAKTRCHILGDGDGDVHGNGNDSFGIAQVIRMSIHAPPTTT